MIDRRKFGSIQNKILEKKYLSTYISTNLWNAISASLYNRNMHNSIKFTTAKSS